MASMSLWRFSSSATRRSLFLLALEQLSGAFGRYIGSALGVIARFVSLTPGFVFVNEAALRRSIHQLYLSPTAPLMPSRLPPSVLPTANS
jgi:hypothetical protein